MSVIYTNTEPIYIFINSKFNFRLYIRSDFQTLESQSSTRDDKEEQRLKLYLLRQKSTINETLIFFKIVSFNSQCINSNVISIGKDITEASVLIWGEAAIS